MRLISLLLMTMAVTTAPVSADPLRDLASEFFGPLPTTPPEIEGNPASPEKFELGKFLYFDQRYSSAGAMSCNSCHDLAKAGQDGLVTPIRHDGSQDLRNTTSVYNHVLNESFFWDGTDANLDEQHDRPMTEGINMLNKNDAAVEAIKAIPGYAPLFAAAFPGESDPITLENTVEAIEIFVATLQTPGPFDAWLEGDDSALTDDQKAGLQVFLDRGCSFCHFGPNLGGAGYYPLGLVELPGVEVKAADELALAEAGDPAVNDFIFRTAPLRNVTQTGPYFHSGKVADLSVAVDVMAAGQLGSPLSPEENAAIVAFLGSLSGTMPEIATPTLP